MKYSGNIGEFVDGRRAEMFRLHAPQPFVRY